MSELSVEGRRISWRVLGSGAWLLAPECNYSWTSAMVEAMSRDFALIVASPTDFGVSERVGAPYSPVRWAADLEAVLDHLKVEQCGVFGYSFTGAFGPWLARHLPNRIVAIAAGGFPLLGDYAVTADDVRSQLATIEADPAMFEALHRDRFDPRAGAAFYDDLGWLPDNALVDDCPLPALLLLGRPGCRRRGNGNAERRPRSRTRPTRSATSSPSRLRPRRPQ